MLWLVVLLVIVLVIVLAGALMVGPDLKRYMRIRRM